MMTAVETTACATVVSLQGQINSATAAAAEAQVLSIVF